MVTFFQVCMKYYYFFPYKIIIQLSPEVEVNSGNDRDAKRRGIYLAPWTDPEGGVVVLEFTKSVG